MASTPPSALSAKKPVVLDAHLHVWPSPSTFTYAEGKAPPDALAEVSSAEALLEQFTKAGVDGCMIVQPINLGFDHTYVSSVIQKYPGKFVGCCLADPTEGGGGVDELARLLDSGYRAVRFNPGLWPAGEKMTNKIGRDMFKLCGERGVAVGFMCFHGLDLSIEEIETLCAEYPDTPVLMDHFGFAKGTKDPNWEKLLALAGSRMSASRLPRSSGWSPRVARTRGRIRAPGRSSGSSWMRSGRRGWCGGPISRLC